MREGYLGVDVHGTLWDYRRETLTRRIQEGFPPVEEPYSFFLEEAKRERIIGRLKTIGNSVGISGLLPFIYSLSEDASPKNLFVIGGLSVMVVGALISYAGDFFEKSYNLR